MSRRSAAASSSTHQRRLTAPVSWTASAAAPLLAPGSPPHLDDSPATCCCCCGRIPAASGSALAVVGAVDQFICHVCLRASTRRCCLPDVGEPRLACIFWKYTVPGSDGAAIPSEETVAALSVDANISSLRRSLQSGLLRGRSTRAVSARHSCALSRRVDSKRPQQPSWRFLVLADKNTVRCEHCRHRRGAQLFHLCCGALQQPYRQ